VAQDINTSTTPLPVPRWMRRLAVFGILANSFVFIVVNYWIYTARILFIAGHPKYVAKRPPTISRAISDNLIGDPFAFWIAVSAVFLMLAMIPIAALYYRASHSARAISNPVHRKIGILASLAISSQFFAAIGMYMLSNFRFPDNRDLHMTGSYLFFGFQALTVILSAMACWQIARNPEVRAHLKYDWAVTPWMSALRWKIAIIAVLMAVGYIILFVAKDIDLPQAHKMIYASYVLLEPAVITAFLIYLLTFNIDMARLIIGPRR